MSFKKSLHTIPGIALYIGLALLSCAAGTGERQHAPTDLRSAIVRISATSFGNPRSGTGFIVRLETQDVYIVTASHVIEGAEVKVAFSVEPDELLSARIVAQQSENPDGLAVLKIRNNIPIGISALPIDTVRGVRPGESLLLIGFPRDSRSPLLTAGIAAGHDGIQIVFDRASDEGDSGGPLVRAGKIVGVVTRTDRKYTYAVPATILQMALDGWQVHATTDIKKEPASSDSVLAAPPSGLPSQESLVFPKIIQFKVKKKGLLSGSFDLTFGDDLNARNDDRYLLTLRHFDGLGLTSNQELWSMIFKEDLSLYGHVVLADHESGDVIRQLYVDADCRIISSQEKTRCLKYQDQLKGEDYNITTELSEHYPVLDLISAIIVATSHASKPGDGDEDFYFFYNSTMRPVTLIYHGIEEIWTPIGRKATAVYALKIKDQDIEFYRFYIGRVKSGYYPVKMLFTAEGNELLEFIADEVIWP